MNTKEYNELFSIIDIYYNKINNSSDLNWARWTSHSVGSDVVYCQFCKNNFYIKSTYLLDKEFCFAQIIEHGLSHCSKSIKLFL